jgi:hypothetical protein
MSIQLTSEQLAKRKLNLGCGSYPNPEALNVDARAEASIDVQLDINDPEQISSLPKAHYKHIEMSHVLEHLDDVFATMKAVEGLLAPGGILEIRVPHFSRGFTHADHRHGFDLSFPCYFNPKLKSFYLGPTLDLQSMKLTWAIRPDLYGEVASQWQVAVLKFLNAIFTPLANLSPGACSRLWCFWVGGFEQMEFIFKKPN